MDALVGLAGIRLLTLASYNRKPLTEFIVLQASPGVIGCVKTSRSCWTEGDGREVYDQLHAGGFDGWGTQVGVAAAIVGLGGPLEVIVRSARREGGVSMVGSMVGFMAVAIVGGLWVFG